MSKLDDAMRARENEDALIQSIMAGMKTAVVRSMARKRPGDYGHAEN